jgi:hypothetical protein
MEGLRRRGSLSSLDTLSSRLLPGETAGGLDEVGLEAGRASLLATSLLAASTLLALSLATLSAALLAVPLTATELLAFSLATEPAALNTLLLPCDNVDAIKVMKCGSLEQTG